MAISIVLTQQGMKLREMSSSSTGISPPPVDASNLEAYASLTTRDIKKAAVDTAGFVVHNALLDSGAAVSIINVKYIMDAVRTNMAAAAKGDSAATQWLEGLTIFSMAHNNPRLSGVVEGATALSYGVVQFYGYGNPENRGSGELKPWGHPDRPMEFLMQADPPFGCLISNPALPSDEFGGTQGEAFRSAHFYNKDRGKGFTAKATRVGAIPWLAWADAEMTSRKETTKAGAQATNQTTQKHVSAAKVAMGGPGSAPSQSLSVPSVPASAAEHRFAQGKHGQGFRGPKDTSHPQASATIQRDPLTIHRDSHCLKYLNLLEKTLAIEETSTSVSSEATPTKCSYSECTRDHNHATHVALLKKIAASRHHRAPVPVQAAPLPVAVAVPAPAPVPSVVLPQAPVPSVSSVADVQAIIVTMQQQQQQHMSMQQQQHMAQMQLLQQQMIKPTPVQHMPPSQQVQQRYMPGQQYQRDGQHLQTMHMPNQGMSEFPQMVAGLTHTGHQGMPMSYQQAGGMMNGGMGFNPLPYMSQQGQQGTPMSNQQAGGMINGGMGFNSFPYMFQQHQQGSQNA
jgi:hypothetical protein